MLIVSREFGSTRYLKPMGYLTMIVQCCVCKKVRTNGSWTEPGERTEDAMSVSHGYCPECAAHAFAQIATPPAKNRKLGGKSFNAA